MKKITLLPLALALVANLSMAANSVDLSVTGTITPAACDIALAGGDFDFGTINTSDLSAGSTTTLPDLDAGHSLSITCSAPTQVSFRLIDNRLSSRPSGSSNDSLGFGVDGSNNPIGSYRIWAGSLLADGEGAYLKATNCGGCNWFTAGLPSELVRPLNSYAYAIDPISNGFSAPIPITNASATLAIRNATIQPASSLDTSTDITLDGAATIELVYL
ncbi:DUF1120 domain-containing protein [Pseudomonas resinovorans]|uniref:DUF1120 domain-containing protein n=1 Tax=Metapseudomonas resinovorans TaxID=53412 RepID=A0ABT4YBU4_METRE|nr:DUF1120 domain-containing protein [Pseudomonas resinovorans]MDA8486363.1 DUF1120 domain-containing protein [Pseudomonas resinovorans]